MPAFWNWNWKLKIAKRIMNRLLSIHFNSEISLIHLAILPWKVHAVSPRYFLISFLVIVTKLLEKNCEERHVDSS